MRFVRTIPPFGWKHSIRRNPPKDNSNFAIILSEEYIRARQTARHRRVYTELADIEDASHHPCRVFPSSWRRKPKMRIPKLLPAGIRRQWVSFAIDIEVLWWQISIHWDKRVCEWAFWLPCSRQYFCLRWVKTMMWFTWYSIVGWFTSFDDWLN